MSETLTHAELVQRAREAVARSGLSQSEIARRVGMAQPTVAQAITRGSTRYTVTLARILSALTGECWTVEKRAVKHR